MDKILAYFETLELANGKIKMPSIKRNISKPNQTRKAVKRDSPIKSVD